MEKVTFKIILNPKIISVKMMFGHMTTDCLFLFLASNKNIKHSDIMISF